MVSMGAKTAEIVGSVKHYGVDFHKESKFLHGQCFFDDFSATTKYLPKF